jgi:L-amino acid N-acyltransferase YncA
MTSLRRVDSSAGEALRAFLGSVPEGERRWFKDDVTDPATVTAWQEAGTDRFVAVDDDDGSVLAYGAIHLGQGWSRHVGEAVIIVAPTARRRGLGSLMARHVLVAGLSAGLKKIVAEVVADETGAIAMFGRLGFEPEALLRDHVCDREGRLRDLVILSHPVGENWAVMAATGVEDALA